MKSLYETLLESALSPEIVKAKEFADLISDAMGIKMSDKEIRNKAMKALNDKDKTKELLAKMYAKAEKRKVKAKRFKSEKAEIAAWNKKASINLPHLVVPKSFNGSLKDFFNTETQSIY